MSKWKKVSWLRHSHVYFRWHFYSLRPLNGSEPNFQRRYHRSRQPGGFNLILKYPTLAGLQEPLIPLSILSGRMARRNAWHTPALYGRLSNKTKQNEANSVLDRILDVLFCVRVFPRVVHLLHFKPAAVLYFFHPLQGLYSARCSPHAVRFLAHQFIHPIKTVPFSKYNSFWQRKWSYSSKNFRTDGLLWVATN